MQKNLIENGLTKNVRIQVTGGIYAGRRGRAIRELNRSTWLVKLDGRMSGATVALSDLRREGITD